MINKVILLGNVGSDPEVRTFEEGVKVARLRVATTERTYNPKTQERSEKTQWHTVTLWRGLASVAEQYIRKGSQVYIEGKLNYTEWQDATGNKRFGVEVIGDEMKMLGGKRPEGFAQPQQGTPTQPQNEPYSHQQHAPKTYQQTPQPAAQQQYQGGGFNPDDEDLPF